MKQYSKLTKAFVILLPIILLPAIYFVAEFLSHYTHFFPPCVSYTLFHFHCPGCGLTRSVLALLNGDILLSIRQNFIPVFSIIAGAWLYIELVLYVFNKKPPFTLLKTKYLWAFLIILLIYTVVRNIFTALAPI